jgi:transcriptional regulator with XRE-family HTH domain
MVNDKNSMNLGRILKQQRLMIPLTLAQLATTSGISPSHLGRIERGERFPSASILRKIAKPLGFEESELFSLAGYLSSLPSGIEERKAEYGVGQLDPYVSKMLSQEPVEVQRTVIGILSILKNIAQAMKGGQE